MFQNIQYINVPNTNVSDKQRPLQLTVYALSTCGFCKRGLAWLNAHGFAYDYIYLDNIPIDVKNEIKKALFDQFHVSVAFPFLVINEKQPLVGFIEEEWKKNLEKDQ